MKYSLAQPTGDRDGGNPSEPPSANVGRGRRPGGRIKKGMTVVPRKRTINTRADERQLWVESVSSLMQEAAVELLNAATVSNPPQC